MTTDMNLDEGVEQSLDALASGARCIVASVDGDPATSRRLMELGLIPGTAVELIRRAPLGDPLEITVRGVHMWLRRSEARRIHVTPA